MSNYTIDQAQKDIASLRFQLTSLINAAIVGTLRVSGISSFVGTVTFPDGSTWSGSGPTFQSDPTFPTPLGISQGGTGASSAGSALSNLGGAPKASPTFTGTVTLPDGSTWSTSGLTLGNTETFADGSSWSSSGLSSPSGNFLKYTAGADGVVYDAGRNCNRVTSTVTINSTSPITITSVNVGAFTYRCRIHIVYEGGSTASSAVIGLNGSCTVSNMVGTLRHARASTTSDAFVGIPNSNGAIGNQTFAFNASELGTYEFEGIVAFSAGGSFSVRGQEATSGDTWVVAVNSYMEMIPVT